MKLYARLSPYLLLCMVIGVFLFNYYVCPAHDELAYAYRGMSTPMVGEVDRISSFRDIVNLQIGDYFRSYGNGRIIVHSIVSFFSGFKLYTLFDVLNTGVWFLFTWLVLKASKIHSPNIKTFLSYALVVYLFLWYGEMVGNAAFAVNYLWTATATIAMMMAWKKHASWWLVPIGFIYGWTQECFVLPFIATLPLYALLLSWKEKRLAVSWAQILTWGAMLAGACFLCFGPASLGRAEQSSSLALTNFIIESIRSQVGLLFLFWPGILLVLLLIIVWKHRAQLLQLLFKHLEWWIYLFMAYGFYCVSSTQVVLRAAMPMLLASVILLLRERSCFSGLKWAKQTLLIFTFIWFAVGVVLQIKIGREYQSMLTHYASNPQGITCQTTVTTGLHTFMIVQHSFKRWHRLLSRLECNKPDIPPAIFSPWLYETLYCSSEEYFREARPLFDEIFYVNSRMPQVIVAKGDVKPSESQVEFLKDYFAHLTAKTRLPFWVPGRIRQMFPDEHYSFGLPRDRFVFTNKDGEVFTLFVYEEKKKKGVKTKNIKEITNPWL